MILRSLTIWLKRIFPRIYIKHGLAKLRREQAALIKKIPSSKRDNSTENYANRNSLAVLRQEETDFRYWQLSLDDEALMRRAAKIGVYPDDIAFSYDEDPSLNDGRYHRVAEFGYRVLIDEFRTPLLKAVREREPIYRKERREQIETYVKLIAAITGMLGTATGLILAWRK